MDITLPFNFRRYNRGFPKGKLVEEDEYTKTFTFNVRNVLDYLYNMGYNSFNAKAFRKYITCFNLAGARLERLNELDTYATDKSIVEHIERETKDG